MIKYGTNYKPLGVNYLFNKMFHRLLPTTWAPYIVYAFSPFAHAQQYSSSIQSSPIKEMDYNEFLNMQSKQL